MKLKQKLSPTLLVAAALIGNLPAAEMSDVTYTDLGTTIQIEACDPLAAGTLTIPATINGKPVTEIKEHAFEGCENLTGITLPNSINRIGQGSFSYCTQLTSIVIPDAVTVIETETFADCYNLTNVTLPSNLVTIDEWAFFDCKFLQIVIPPSVTTIGSRAFYSSSLENITLSNNLTSIGDWAFAHCNMTSINIPPNVIHIGKGALLETPLEEIRVDSNNPSFSAVDGVLFNKNQTTLIAYPSGHWGNYDIPQGVTTISPVAFNGCFGLTGITIPDSVINIGVYAFSNCTLINTIKLPANLTTIENFTFSGCTTLDQIEIGGAITNIGDYAFYSCEALEKAIFGSNVTTIGANAFAYCGNLSQLFFRGNAPVCGTNAFGQTALNQPDSGAVYYLPEKTGWGPLFAGAPTYEAGIPEISYQPSETNSTIGATGYLISFAEGVSLSYQWQKNGQDIFNTEEISGANTETLTINNTQPSDAGQYRVIISNPFGTITGPETNFLPLPYTYVNGEGNITITGYSGPGGNLIIPGTIDSCPVTTIGSWAFWQHNEITSISIPDTVTDINEYAFYGCSDLETIHFGKSVSIVGNHAFSYCTSLTKLTLPAFIAALRYEAFMGCEQLSEVLFHGPSPYMEENVFGGTRDDFTAYYFEGSHGFTSPTWYGYPATSMGLGTPAAHWLLENSLPYNVNLQEDFNQDGVSLLMAYALNLDPNQNLSGSMPQPKVADDQLSLSFYAGADGINYSVETSDDLQTWTTSGVELTPPDSNEIQTASVAITGPARYLRIIVRN